MTADYVIPESIPLSSECKDLIRRIFVVNPGMRINLDQIKTHPWFVRNLPLELQQGNLNPTVPTQADSVQAAEEVGRGCAVLWQLVAFAACCVCMLRSSWPVFQHVLLCLETILGCADNFCVTLTGR